MTEILYYSNYCNNCKPLLQKIYKIDKDIQKEMHFLSIDKRVKKPDGSTYIVLENGQELLLPPLITKVPALLLLSKGNHVLFGNSITEHLERKIKAKQKQQFNECEPTTFDQFGISFSLSGNDRIVCSDMYSFLDQDTAAQGNGGMRIQYNYSSLNDYESIDTPPDTYSSEKGGTNVSMDQLQQLRSNDIKN